MKSILAGALSLVLAGALPVGAQTKAAPVAAVPLLDAGLWEIQIVEQAPNTTTKRTTVSRVCYSADDATVLERVIPSQRSFGMKCENLDPRAQGTAIGWKVVCRGKEGSTSGAATMTLGTASYTAQVKLDSHFAGKAGKLEQVISGKRVGACN